MGTDVFMECKILRLLPDAEGRISGAVGYMRPTGEMVALHRQGRRPRHGLDRQVVEVHLQLVGVRRRRPRHGHLGRRRRHRHGVRAVPPDRHGVAAVGARHPRHRGRARRRRRAAQLRGQALHVQLRGRHVPGRDGGDRRGSRRLVRGPQQQPAHARPPAPRRGGPRHQLRGEGGPGQPARRRLPRHRLAAHAPSTSGAGCPPCTTSSWSWPASTSRPRPMEVGPDLPLHDGRRAGRRRDPGRHRAGPLRRRRGGGRHARRQPPGRQLALGPDRLRPPGRHRRGRLRGGPRRLAERRRGGGRLGDRRRLRALRARGRAQPLRRPARAAGDHAVAGRHHPHRARARGGAGQARGPQAADGQGAGEGRPRLQPGLEPGHRPALHDHHLHRRGPGRAQPQGVPRRAHPGGLSRGPTPSWARSTSCSARPASTATWRRSPSPPSRCPRCRAELRALFEEGH